MLNIQTHSNDYPTSHHRNGHSLFVTGLLILVFMAFSVTSALAGPREQARRMHDRLTGTPPSEAVLTSMAAQIQAGNPLMAAEQAMTNSMFYMSLLKNFITPWTNEAQDVQPPLNDYTATAIGMIRDDVPLNQVLSADLVYVGAPGVVSTPYDHTNNDHYQELEADRVDLSDPTKLIAVTQSGLPGAVLASGDTAGVMTTRAAGEAFFSAGTNRRMWRFTAMNYLCRDMEQLTDITRPVDRIRQDVSRVPGGDSTLFLNSCTGCHSGMDPMAQAFAYFEFDDELGRVIHTPGQVQDKYLINATTFPLGFMTPDNRWDNFWRTGPNAALGWPNTSSGGFGAKSFGEEVANSRAFSICQVEKVFKQVCFRPASSSTDSDGIGRIADVFEADNYRLKTVYAETAAFCMGD